MTTISVNGDLVESGTVYSSVTTDSAVYTNDKSINELIDEIGIIKAVIMSCPELKEAYTQEVLIRKLKGEKVGNHNR